MAGIFLGWEMNAGCKLNGIYRVAPLESFGKVALREDNVIRDASVNAVLMSRISWLLVVFWEADIDWVSRSCQRTKLARTH